jgi:signal transduction histidine kinase
LLLAALYFVAGRLSLELTHYHDRATLVVWAPTGLSLAALILFGRRLWPGILIGALLVNLALSSGWFSIAAIAIGNTLEAVVGVTLLIRVAEFRPTLERPRDGAFFLLFGVLVCTTISATIGTGSVFLSGGAADFGQVWLVWWLSTAGGALILTPVLLMLIRGNPSWKSLLGRGEFWLVFATLFGTSLFAFFGPNLGMLGFATILASVPPLVWAGTRLGARGATLASFIIILIATIATGIGSGPFVQGTANEAMLLLWPYSVYIGISAFTLAAVVEQRDVAERNYRSEEPIRLRSEKEKLLLIERGRLTREMHDGLGGQLVSALSMVERGTAAPSEVAEVLRRAIDDIRIVIDSLDSDSTDLPVSLGKLRARLEPLLRRNGIELRWSLEEIPGLDVFPPEAALHVLRIIQEAVTNTLRHAHADNVEVRISCSGGERRELHVCICDDGRGLQTPVPEGGRGIKNMRSRAQELGGLLKIDGTGSCTQIDLTIPVPR